MRKRRQLQEGATYHVTSKINRGNMDLQTQAIKFLFMAVAKMAKKKFDFVLYNFCIMDNHIHFLIKPGNNESLSKIMQWIKGNFARKWNKIHGTDGHLWGERFYSRIIKDVDDFLKTDNYIEENPVKAGLVRKAHDWLFSGLFHRLHKIFSLVDPLDEWLFVDY
jgi:REP element-mobilizing transposase RayT